MPTLLESVRAKYPGYADVPDDKLALAIADKYPVYLEKDPSFAGYVQTLKANAAETASTPPPTLTPDNSAPNDRKATAGGSPLVPGTAEDAQATLANVWEDLNKPTFEILPELTPENQRVIREYGGTTDNLTAGAWQGVAGLVNYFTSPLGVATLGTGALPKAAQRVISLAFATQMAAQTPELAKQLGTATAKPMKEWDPQDVAHLTTSALGTTAFATMAAKHGLTPNKDVLISELASQIKNAEFKPRADEVKPVTISTKGGENNGQVQETQRRQETLLTPPGTGTAAQPAPVPEPTATLQAQFAATLDPATPKAATLVTPGAEAEPVPDGLLQVSTDAGVFHFNPKKTSAAQIREAVAKDTYGTLLGMSTETKPASEPAAVLQTKNAEGTPVQEEVITPETLPSAIKAGQAIAPNGTQEVKPPEQVIAERQQAVATEAARPDVPTVTPRHLREARSILDAERAPDVLDEVIDNFKGVRIPDTPDFQWARNRIKELGQNKAAGLSKSTLKTLFNGPEDISNVVTALNAAKPGGTPRYESTDALLEHMIRTAETRIAGKDPNRPEVRQLAEQIAQAEHEANTNPRQPDALDDWEAEVARSNAELGAMSGTAMNASKGGLATEWPALAATMQDVKPMETPEILRLTREAFGSEVTAKRLADNLCGYARANNIALNRDLFADPQAVAMVLAHEIGHVNDFMPEGTMKRGNLIGRLIGSTTKFMHGNQGWLRNAKLREELIALSAYWRPWDRSKAKPSFVKYRDSAKELYADALSVLLNSPGLLQQKAPTFFKAFFDNLDAKPQFKQEFFALQDLLNRGPEAVLGERLAQSREGYEKGEAILHEKIAFRQAARNSFKDFFTKVKIQSLDIAAAAMKKLGSKDPANPSKVQQLYEEWKFADNRNAADLATIYNDMVKPILDTGLDEHSFGQLLELQRIMGRVESYRDMQSLRKALGPDKLAILKAAETKLTELERKGLGETEAAGRIADALERNGIPFELVDTFRQLRDTQGTRAELANPQGRSPIMAEAELNHLLNTVTPEQRAALLDGAKKFRDLIYARAQEAADVGIINRHTFDQTITANKDSYAAFRPLDKIEEFVSPMVRKANGTLSDVENPFITTLLKLQSLNNLIELQKLKNEVRDQMTNLFPGEFVKAETRWTGRRMEAVPAKPDTARVTILENGKPVAYDADPYVAKMFDKLTPEDSFWFNKLLSIPFRLGVYPLIIKYNPGFLFAFNPRRDMARTIRNLYAVEGVTRRELLPNYADKQVLRAVNDYLNGRKNPLADAMIQHKAIGSSWEGFSKAEGQGVMWDLLERYKLASKPERNRIMNGVLWLPEKMNQGGAFLEALPKFASYKTLIERGTAPDRAAYLVRNYAGTPNYRIKGEWASVTNAYLPFINIFLQGWRADLRLAFNPRTAGGWWMQWYLQHGLQATLVALASSGVFGDDIKRRFAGISEYDKTNYGVLPLGHSMTGEFVGQGGKTVYLRTPRDETSRFFSALTYKATRAIADKLVGNPPRPDSLSTEAFAFAEGAMPSPSPILNIASAWTQYATGRNPVDAFRMQPIIQANKFKAGGTAGMGDMMTWTLNQAGVLSLVKYDANANNTTEVVVGATPIANRLLKISDQGHREDQMNSERLDEQAKAQLRVQYNDAVRTLLAQHARLQQLGKDKRTDEQERLYGEIHNWKATSYDRNDADAWDLRENQPAQRQVVTGLNTEATSLVKALKLPLK